MDDRRPVTPLVGPCFHDTGQQREAIRQWENLGWVFLHWTEVPLMLAVMEQDGDIIFIDHQGQAWTGPGFSKIKHVPTENHPPVTGEANHLDRTLE